MATDLQMASFHREGRHMNRYIGVDKLIDDIRPFAEYDSNRSNKDWVRRFEIAINAQPTADVRENVRGEWRTTYFDHVAMGERPKILYCSVCNQCIAYPTNYCPNCGAQMVRGEQ